MKALINLKPTGEIYTYPQYRALLEKQVLVNTVPQDKLMEYTRLNIQRMNRMEKQVKVLPEMYEKLAALKEEQLWLVLSEGWCADGAINIPVIATLAALNPNIKLRLLLRDENLHIMDRYLTNGSRSIPKLIMFDSAGKELGTWGARPAAIQQQMNTYRKENPDVPLDEVKKLLQLWYAKDKGISLQHDLLGLMKEKGRKVLIG